MNAEREGIGEKVDKYPCPTFFGAKIEVKTAILDWYLICLVNEGYQGMLETKMPFFT